MKDTLLAVLAPWGQDHLLAHWDQLDATGRRTLEGEFQTIDFELIDRLWRHREEHQDYRALAERAQPPHALRLETSQNEFSAAEARQRGQEALAAAELGVILVAGGQGTRLGFAQPKGMFPIGSVSGKSLFQIHAEKILAIGRRHGVRVPLYLMTSPATHKPTIAFFEEHHYFGLSEEDVFVFCQGTMPAVDAETGKILLDAPDRVALSPDGHGGMLAALEISGALGDIRRRGIRQLFYFQVDNPLVEVCSPEFLGYHLLSASEMSSQAIAKRDANERVGNLVQVDGRSMVIEYSDLPEDLATRRMDDGAPVFWAGSIAVHALDVALLDRVVHTADALPFHIARKVVPYVDAQGQRIEPTEPNAMKFERFIFDLLPSARNAIVVEIDPAEGFAPLKNATGSLADTPESVKAQMMAQHRRWLRGAGAQVADVVDVEISPLWALDAQQVAQRIEPDTQVTETLYLEQ